MTMKRSVRWWMSALAACELLGCSENKSGLRVPDGAGGQPEVGAASPGAGGIGPSGAGGGALIDAPVSGGAGGSLALDALAGSGGPSGGTPGTGGASGGVGGASRTGGTGGSSCPMVPPCNWCSGTNIYDSNGCVVDWRCANGVSPCTTQACGTSNPCATGYACGTDRLCWPEGTAGAGGGAGGGGGRGGGGGVTSTGGTGGSASTCPGTPACNWCGGQAVTNPDGCITGWRCANGADPCSTEPCPTAYTCPTGYTCENQLCWPAGAAGGAGGGGAVGTGGTTGTTSGPCDIYAEAKTPCAAAYSMIRALSKTYDGPLFQVRAGSSSYNNTMSGGTTRDIMPGPDGFADASAVDEACGTGYCTVSVLYDHSGNGNDLRRAPKGNTGVGATGALDDYESIATKGLVTAGGHKVYSLYMNKLEGYRVQVGVVGKNMPTGSQPQGTYMLADGTRNATECCWDFGNVTSKPATEWRAVDALFFGACNWWGTGAGTGPWFLADFGAGLWAGGARDGDPGSPNPGLGWGVDPPPRENIKNPSLKVPFALGFLKVGSSKYAIRVADLSTANELVTAFDGGLPLSMNSQEGGIVLGVDAGNANYSWGTFYEGAIVAGYPSGDVELSVMKNIKAVGYAKATP